MKHLLTLISLIIIASCSTAKNDVPPQSFSSASGTGLVIGTITFTGYEKPANDIYRFFYEPVTTDKKIRKKNSGRIIIKAREGNTRSYTGDFNEKKTYLFMIEAQPGNYAFTQYNYLDHIGYSGMVTSSQKFSIPFTVSAGTINYLGELSYNDMAQPGSPRIIVGTNIERDLPEFRKKYTNINFDAVTNNPVKSGNTGNGIILFTE